MAERGREGAHRHAHGQLLPHRKRGGGRQRRPRPHACDRRCSAVGWNIVNLYVKGGSRQLRQPQGGCSGPQALYRPSGERRHRSSRPCCDDDVLWLLVHQLCYKDKGGEAGSTAKTSTVHKDTSHELRPSHGRAFIQTIRYCKLHSQFCTRAEGPHQGLDEDDERRTSHSH